MVAVLALAVLTACSAGQSTAAPTGNGESACAGGTTRTFTVSGQQRAVVEHLPAGFVPSTKYPVVIAFPGRGETPADLEGYSQLDTVDAIVLYAKGIDGKGGKPTWEATPYLDSAAHDYEFATDLVKWLAASPCVDATRIGLAGKSDGAGFATSAACTISGIAAVAAISGAFYQQYNHCAGTGQPVPMLDMHGTSDSVMPYAGIADRGVYSIDAWLQLWRQRDRCTDPGVDDTIASDVVRTTWTCADGGQVVNYRVIGGGHNWPGATAASGPGGTTHSVDAAQAIAAFLAAHPRS